MRSLLALALLGCSANATTIPDVRFANAPPVSLVDDRRDVPRMPKSKPFHRILYNLDGQILGPIDRALALETSPRSVGTSSIDEVPDSTWFTNRIGVRPIAPDELRTATEATGSPERYTPWTIHSTKIGGQSVGFIVSDTRGKRFIVKFDERGFAEAETAAQVISGKLLWACGYNVTDDYIAYIRRSDLVLAPDAVAEDVFGNKRKLDTDTVDRRLSRIDIGADGRIRTMASRILDGKALGGHSGKGTRHDDPNDRIPHERRRDLRGAYSIFAWLDHVDVQESQFLDMWITDRADPKRHYVKHYFLDYGNSLGVMARITHNQRRGYEYIVDGPVILRSFFTLGLAPRKWTHRYAPDIRGVGVYEVGAFKPGSWRPTTPAYLPFVFADRFDKFWGAKLVMRFTREQLRAAVEAGRLSDPRATSYLTDALVARQRATGAYWFSRVNPLDNFAATAGGVCFDDLSLVYGFASANSTTYSLVRHDRGGRAIGRPITIAANATGRTCAPVELAAGPEGYTIVRVSTARPGFRGSTYVHLAHEQETGAPHVIGIVRT
jgi:hypothetical protein